MNSTTEDTYPIYYYRGAVTNNNAKFAGFCWKIVRTTETGGTKLIYNGTPNESGQCVNTTGEATELSNKSYFNPLSSSLAQVGYMRGTIYTTSVESILNTSYLYGNDVTYNNGVYTLINTNSEFDNNHHYTCFNGTGTCSQLYYIVDINYGSSGRIADASYLTLVDGKKIADAISETLDNQTDSTIKVAVDSWFQDTFNTYFIQQGKDYNNYLEDTVWCNDRSIYDYGVYNNNGGKLGASLYYGIEGRLRTEIPSLSCPNKNDAFTVEESDAGNGKLTYPIGLLTEDEVILAGGLEQDGNYSYYLYTGQYWWTMTPKFNSYVGAVISGNLGLRYSVAESEKGIRPSISLKPGVKIRAGGDGTAEAPYEFVVE